MRARQAHDEPPASALFDEVTGRADEDLKKLLERFRSQFKGPQPHGVEVEVPFLPYLLIRQEVGDHGQRPITTKLGIYSSMPDIWIFAGEPATAPLIPPGPQPVPPVGAEEGVLLLPDNTRFTVYAHVWNLGRAPIAGARVEFSWLAYEYLSVDFFDPPPLDPSKLRALGVARVDLQQRGAPGCHQLVKCPVALEPPDVSAGLTATACVPFTLALVAQVSALGDPVSAPCDPLTDRHVGRRDFTFWMWVSPS